MERRTLTLKPKAPYDFGLTMGYYPALSQGVASVDVFEKDQYQRLLDMAGKLLLASVRSVGSVERPELGVTVQGYQLPDEDMGSIANKIDWIVGSDVALEEFYPLAAKDPIIGSAVERLYGLHPSRTATFFESFIQSISGQQIAISVSRIIRTLLIENYSPTLTLDGRTYYAFPSPASILSMGIEGLREIKLSTRKAEYILDVAAGIENGTLDLEGLRRLPDDQVANKLLSLRGVGPWTVQWLLIRAFGRPNAFPSGDLVLQRLISRLYFQGQRLSEQEVEKFSQRWSPCRSLFTTYLFTALRQGLVKL